MNSGLLVVRSVFGLLMAAHGAQKLFGWFGGKGLKGVSGLFETLGFRPGRSFALLAGAGEIGSGLLMALGLFGPVGPALMVSVMIVAAVSVHLRHGLFATSNGIEMPLLYAVTAFALALTGPGQISLDSLLAKGELWTPALKGLSLGIGALGGVLSLAMRRQAERMSAPA